MKSKLRMCLGVGLTSVVLSACGGGVGGSAAAPSAQAPLSSSAPIDTASTPTDTAQVLAQARISSETADPYGVDSGAQQMSDTSDTTEPMSVDGV